MGGRKIRDQQSNEVIDVLIVTRHVTIARTWISVKLALSLEGECWSYRAQQYVSIFSPFIHLFYPFIITPSLLCYHHNHLSSYSVINYLISVLHNTSFFMLMFSFSSLNFSSKVET